MLGLYGAVAIPARCCASVQVVPSFVDKVVQLFDRKSVRHANMLVGRTGTGKTTAWRCLQRALARLDRECPTSDLYHQAHALLVPSWSGKRRVRAMLPFIVPDRPQNW